mmetsp:Transcript_16485/g.35826  ORF Transcript_16485/g.35826 Transcript_16485/m.35826 type:complete len:205 (+) Transcript_16485:1070-1684(+)
MDFESDDASDHWMDSESAGAKGAGTRLRAHIGPRRRAPRSIPRGHRNIWRRSRQGKACSAGSHWLCPKTSPHRSRCCPSDFGAAPRPQPNRSRRRSNATPRRCSPAAPPSAVEPRKPSRPRCTRPRRPPFEFGSLDPARRGRSTSRRRALPLDRELDTRDPSCKPPRWNTPSRPRRIPRSALPRADLVCCRIGPVGSRGRSRID